jgi:PhzF family phenazine biosynthesis protein
MAEGTQKKSIPIYQVDAFTSKPFRGNPAAVCPLDGPLKESTMQAIAAEMNLSETAFLLSAEERPIEESSRFSLRWFTPEVEVPLCGHATLATAAVLFQGIGVEGNKVEFETKSGKLSAERVEKGIVLDFPLKGFEPAKPQPELLEVLGIDEFENAATSSDNWYILIQFKDEEAVRSLNPDFERLKSMSVGDDMIGVIATSQGNPPYDFISRFFAPWVGVNEDPVTGSTHTMLAPYWSKILGKKEMLAFQASKRGGTLTVRISEDERVQLIGKAVIVLKGNIYI